jgi:hypothetical protein
VHSLFKRKWNEVLAGGDVAKYLRTVVRIPFSEFRQELRSASSSFVDRFVESVHAGDLWLLQGALTHERVVSVKERVLAFRAAQPESNPILVDGCSNFHQIVDGSTAPSGGYVAIDHSACFFRWNGDEMGLFTILDEAWQMLKIVSGRAPDEYAANLPRDLYIDRIQVIQYPAGIGKISSHVDPYVTMKANFGIYLSTQGIDFQRGGFWIAEGPDRPVLLDPQVTAGDALFWFPNLRHGVETIDPGLPINWASPGGRWFVALNTIESAFVRERHVARPAR